MTFKISHSQSKCLFLCMGELQFALIKMSNLQQFEIGIKKFLGKTK